MQTNYEIPVPKGYRKVQSDETIQKGDYVLEKWKQVGNSVGLPASHYPHHCFIRKVVPDLNLHSDGFPLIPAGYRAIGPKEVLESRDFFWTPGSPSWNSVTAYGRPACDATFNADTLYIRPR